MVESRSVIRNAKNARGPPFPSRARLNFTFNKFPLRILSESLAQATKVSATSVSAKVIRLECLCKIKTREPGNFLNELFEPGTDAYNNICRYKVCSCLVLL